MAASVLLLGFVCTVGLAAGSSKGLELGLGFVEEPSSVVAIRNKALLLGCSPSTPNTNVSWTLDNQPLVLDSRHRLFPNGSLYIKKVIHKKKGHGTSDAGVYRCILRNSYGAIVSRPANVQIAGMSHEFSSEPENVTVLEGDAVRLTCSIDSVPPATIVWQRDFRPLPQNKRYVITDSGVLYIVNAKKDDSGKYRCHATNTLTKKEKQSEEGILSVTHNPGIPSSLRFLPDSPSSALILTKGQNGSLICSAQGQPKPSLSWIHTTTDGTNKTIQATSNGLNVLRIANMSEEYVGIYTCIASQTVKDTVTSSYKTLNLTIYSSPVIVHKPKSQVYPAASTVRIECEVQGSPEPRVTWLKDANKLHTDGRIRQKPKGLILSGVITQDSGVYQCVAGDVWGAGKLVVNTSNNQSKPPIQVSCSTISPSRVKLSWLKPPIEDGGAPIAAYSVHYNEGEVERTAVTNYTSIIVQPLAPFTNYTFYVKSYSGPNHDLAVSDPSQTVTCSTGEAIPTGGPLVTVSSAASRCLIVSWYPPPASQARGTITKYKVQWKRTNQTSTYFEILPGYVNRYGITGLKSGQEYWVRVIGATALGWPDLNDQQAPWINVTTLKSESVYLSSPEVHLTTINASTILADWKYPDNKIIDGFWLSYGKIDVETKEKFTLLPNHTSFLITGLEPASWYEVSVSAFTQETIGETCIENVFTYEPLKIATLPPPFNVEAHPASANDIEIMWSSLNAHIAYYTVIYNPLYNSPLSRSLQTNTTNARISGLKANTVYELTVVAHGFNNEISVNSSKLECLTLSEAVSMIVDVEWKSTSSSTVRVTWKSLRNVSHYRIFYSKDLSAPMNLWDQMKVPGNKSYIELTGLEQNVQYVMKIQIFGQSSSNIFSTPVFFKIPTISGDDVSPTLQSPEPPGNTSSDQFLGILVGCGISVCCIIVCTGTLLYRKKCVKYPRNSTANSNTQHSPCSAQHEMQSLTNFDSKEGYPSERPNGLKFPIVYNGFVPNGQTRDNCVHITENPQYEVYKGQEGEGSRTTDEGDSLLSGPELELEGDETQLTLVETTVIKDTVPDDGFHETNHNILLAPNG